MRSSPSLSRTWNPATLSWAVFWSGAALVLTALALFTGPHHPAFYGFLIIAWAGTLALVIAPAIIGPGMTVPRRFPRQAGHRK